MTNKEILDKLPFSDPYLFVDELHYVNDKGASGSFTFKENLDFFRGHFKSKPIVPGAILTETMAQIGLVTLGIYLTSSDETVNKLVIFASSYNVAFLKPVFPNEKVIVTSELIYFRFGKIRCKVIMKNEHGDIVSDGIIDGFQLKNSLHEN